MAKEFFKNLPSQETPFNASRWNGLLNGEESMGSIVVEDVTCKNLCPGVSQGYYITTASTSFGRTATDNGLVIEVEENTDYTISTTDTQARYRIAFTNTLLSIGDSSSDVYNALTKDGTKENITRNSGTYKYLIVNATDLSKIQVEKGPIATGFVEHKEFKNPITKTLWTNPNPTANFPYTASIILSSSDYDEYEVLCYTSTSNTQLVSSGRIKAGYGTNITYLMGYQGNIFNREFTYISKTSFRAAACYGYGKDYPTPPVEANNYLIPAYIIGYKY